MNKHLLHCFAVLFFAIALAGFRPSEVAGQLPDGSMPETARPATKIQSHVRRRSGKRQSKSINNGSGRRLVNLLIISDPPNSIVLIDDVLKGVTDENGELEVMLPPKIYQLRVSREGYNSQRNELEIMAPPLEQEVEVKLAPLRRNLKVTTDPPEAEVYLDDAYKGTSSADGILLIEGVNLSQPHTLRAKKEGYQKSIPVPPNSSLIPIKLSIDFITLRVTTDPPEMEVYLDDTYKGVSSAEGLLLIEQVNPIQPHILRGRKEGYDIKDGKVSVSPSASQASLKLEPDPRLVGARSLKQHLSSGRLSEAFGAYNSLAQDKPDYEDLPRLLDSILQNLQARSSNRIMQMGPYGLLISLEEAQEMNQLYEQASKLRQGDSAIAGLAEYWKMKYLTTKAKQTSATSEREALLRHALTVAPIVEALNSQNAYLVFDVAWVYRMLGNDTTAKKGYEMTQRLNPNWAFSYFALGLMDMSAAEQEKTKSLKKTQYKAGIEKFNKALNVKPDFFQAYMMLCISYGVLNMHQEAIYNGQQAVAMKPQSAYAHFALGFAYYQKGKPEYRNALSEFERALSLTEDELDEGTKSVVQQRLARIKKSLGIKH
jgi:tetratricopeptide (TPR) repeat protein